MSTTPTMSTPAIRTRVKCVMLGLYNAGKSSLVHRWRTGQFVREGLEGTIGADFSCKHQTDGHVVEFWDTGGQSRMQTMIMQYIFNAAVCIIVFDATTVDDVGWPKAVEHYLDLIESHPTQRPRIVWLIGTKLDLLCKEPPTVPISVIGRVHGLTFVSAKTGEYAAPAWTNIWSAVLETQYVLPAVSSLSSFDSLLSSTKSSLTYKDVAKLYVVNDVGIPSTTAVIGKNGAATTTARPKPVRRCCVVQ